MAEFSVEYINPFLMAATSVIKDICQVDMKIGRLYVKTTEFASDSVIIMIGVTGEVRGQVLMSFPEAHALHVASKMMMGMPVTALDDMSASAINELGNMMMGNAATILSTKGIAMDITPPTLCRGNVYLKQSYSQNICVPLTSDEIHMELDIAINVN